MSEKFVLATHNPGKLREMREILSELGVEVMSLDEIGVQVEIEEIGVTFAENAMLKAKVVCSKTGLPAIGDDSGLCADALNGGPGVYSARYGGESLTDEQRNKLLLESVKGQGTRNAHFICSIACAFPNGDTLTAEGRCDGIINYIPMGTGGFGYDPIFNYTPMCKTFAQMTPEEKSAVSHRGKALRAFAETLGAYLSERAWNELEAEKEFQDEEEDAPDAVENAETSEAVATAEADASDAVETADAETPEVVETADAKTPEVVVETADAETPDAVETAETETPEVAETVKDVEADTAKDAPQHHKKKKRKKHH